jgi:hypothetical protein
MKVSLWTLTQHSAAPGKPGFARAVQLTPVTTETDRARVARAGGLLLATYEEADARELAENYPPGVRGLYPRCAGSFAAARVGGRPVYRPAGDPEGKPDPR